MFHYIFETKIVKNLKFNILKLFAKEMFTIIGIQLEYQSTYVIGFIAEVIYLIKKGVIKKRCSFDVQIITKIDT